MATSASLLASIGTAIENLLAAINDDAVQEYSIGGRTYKRADFGRTLDALFKQRDKLQVLAARESSSPIRLAKFGHPRGVDR